MLNLEVCQSWRPRARSGIDDSEFFFQTRVQESYKYYADVSNANSCIFRFLTLLLDGLKDTGRIIVFGEIVVALRTNAEGLANRFDWELE
jgi:hypothetical protein